MEFRCDLDGIWHCSVGCPNWPVESFNVIRMEKLPPDFELCNNCNTLRASRGIFGRENAARRWAFVAVPLLLLILAFYVADCFADWMREE
jgi:hypothetical protein